MRNLQEQVKKAFCHQKLFWPFPVWINCSSDLKNFANSQHSASHFKSFSRSLGQFFLTVGQNNFGNKIPRFRFQDSGFDLMSTLLISICFSRKNRKKTKTDRCWWWSFRCFFHDNQVGALTRMRRFFKAWKKLEKSMLSKALLHFRSFGQTSTEKSCNFSNVHMLLLKVGYNHKH